MTEIFEAGGAPRDQGLDQGLALRGAVRDRAVRAGVSTRRRRALSLAPFASGSILGSGPGREMIRHYTHLAERAEGLALGAELRLETLVELLFREPGVLRVDALSVALGAPGADRPRLARVLPPGSTSERWVLRRSRPEVGFASVEVTLPWLATAVAGVNSEGLAVMLAPGGAPAFPALLVQEALQRFGDIPSALDWCDKRPGSGSGSLLLGDASGAVAAVHFEAEERRLERTEPGVRSGLAAGGSSEVRASVRKGIDAWLGSDRPLDDAVVDALLESGPAPVASRVRVLPGERRLVLADGRGGETAIGLEAD